MIILVEYGLGGDRGLYAGVSGEVTVYVVIVISSESDVK